MHAVSAKTPKLHPTPSPSLVRQWSYRSNERHISCLLYVLCTTLAFENVRYLWVRLTCHICFFYHLQVFPANDNATLLVKRYLPAPVIARRLRLTFINEKIRKCLRFEVYGSSLGMWLVCDTTTDLIDWINNNNNHSSYCAFAKPQESLYNCEKWKCNYFLM